MFYAKATDYKGKNIRIVVTHQDGSVVLQFGRENADKPSVVITLHPEDAERFGMDILEVLDDMVSRSVQKITVQ